MEKTEVCLPTLKLDAGIVPGAQYTLPAVLLEILEPGFTLNPLYRNLGVTLDNTVEVNMEALLSLNKELALRAFNYYTKCQNFYDSLVAAKPNSLAYETERTLISVKQLDTNKVRADLKLECKLLAKLPLFGPLVTKLLSAKPDFNNLQLEAKTLGAEIIFEGNITTFQFALPGRDSWPLELGGVNSRGELTRNFTLTISHAPWRDRKSRRLLSMQVDTIELWPEE